MINQKSINIYLVQGKCNKINKKVFYFNWFLSYCSGLLLLDHAQFQLGNSFLYIMQLPTENIFNRN